MERIRHFEVEGWDGEHDQLHKHGELPIAAACYAVNGTDAGCFLGSEDAWHWDESWDKRKKHDRIKQLVIAGSLIAAEIDRIQGNKERYDGADLRQWVAEASPSAADSSVLVEALKRIEKICLRDAVGIEPMQKHFRDIYELATTTLAQYNAVEPEKDQDDAFIKKHVAIIKEKILENSIQIKMQHLQRPPMDASVKYFLEKGTVSGNFMLAIKDIIFGLPKMIQEELNAQTPRTPISQPGELDTVGEHPSDREPEETEIEKLKDSLGAAKMALEAIMKGEAIFPRTLAQQTLIIINGE